MGRLNAPAAELNHNLRQQTVLYTVNMSVDVLMNVTHF